MRFSPLILLVLFASSAHAYIDARCKEEGCLKSGWTNYGPGISQDVTCRDDDCAKFGWVFTNNPNDFQSLVLCEGDGCFESGFTEYNNETGKKISTLTCRSDKKGVSDCMKNGWVVEIPQGRAVTRCKWGDCEAFGWVTRGFGRTEIVECKPGGCFEEGWIVR